MANYSSIPVDDATPRAHDSKASSLKRLVASAVVLSFALGAVGAVAVASTVGTVSRSTDEIRSGGQAVLFEKPAQLVAAASAIDATLDGVSYIVQTAPRGPGETPTTTTPPWGDWTEPPAYTLQGFPTLCQPLISSEEVRRGASAYVVKQVLDPQTYRVPDVTQRSINGLCCDCCHSCCAKGPCGRFPFLGVGNQFLTPLQFANLARLGHDLAGGALAELVQARAAAARRKSSPAALLIARKRAEPTEWDRLSRKSFERRRSALALAR